MSHKVEFIVTELGRQDDPFVLHLFAALAQKERALISRRTREALKQAKARGTKLGMLARTEQSVREIARKGSDANMKAAKARVEPMRKAISDALEMAGSLRAAATLLNDWNVLAPGGGRWHAPSLLNSARRLGLRKTLPRSLQPNVRRQ